MAALVLPSVAGSATILGRLAPPAVLAVGGAAVAPGLLARRRRRPAGRAAGHGRDAGRVSPRARASPYVAATVAVTGVLGGAVGAFRPPRAVAAGIAGGVAATALGLVVAFFQNDLRQPLRQPETVGTHGRRGRPGLQLTTSVVSGVLAGGRGLRLPAPHRARAAAGRRTRWPAPAAGLLTLVATLLGWLGRLPLTGSSRTTASSTRRSSQPAARADQPRLIVLFVGRVHAMILGRADHAPARRLRCALRPARPARPARTVVPLQLVILGAVHGELRVRVAGGGLLHHVRGGRHLRLGVAARRRGSRRPSAAAPCPATSTWLDPRSSPAIFSTVPGRSTDTHHPPAGRLRVVPQQPQRALGGPGERDVLEFLLVALGIPLPQRGRDGVRLGRRGQLAALRAGRPASATVAGRYTRVRSLVTTPVLHPCSRFWRAK